MMKLDADGHRLLQEIARRHDVSEDAAMAALKALARGNGVQAQFDHPELGGMGQWSGGGMVMVGDIFNHRLKARVDALCTDLAEQLRAGRIILLNTPSDRRTSSGPWPAELGEPASSGGQNDFRYAYFPSARRLAVERGGEVTFYDTSDHKITGVSQQQSHSGSVKFTSQLGEIDLASLQVVTAPTRAEGDPQRSENSIDEWDIPEPTARKPERTGDADIFTTIERLHDLRQKQIITAQEFETKKAELLSRL